MNETTTLITSSEDLVTTYEETRAGFIDMALEKNRRAAPFLVEARALQYSVKDVKTPEQLLDVPDIRGGLIAAAGISDKAASHLGEEGCTAAIQEFIKNFLLPANSKFREELVFRFLLTRGDSLGGKMRNIVGALAQRKMCRSIIAALRLSGLPFYALPDTAEQWVSSADVDDDMELETAKSVSWNMPDGSPRTVLFNVNVPVVRNNIDIVVLKTPHDAVMKDALARPESYVALGELKGGIDPAGADEHWKTAKMALDRIYEAFRKKRLMPRLFFIGAAIAAKMAVEIYENLRSDYISFAANLTKPDQVAALVLWLVRV